MSMWLWMLFGMIFLGACKSDEIVVETAVLNPTHQAIADVLTYQAANPRPTRTPDRWVGFVRTATAEALLTPTATPTLNATQETIAVYLTYQAVNPRPTKTRWSGSNIMQTEMARRTVTPQGTPTAPPTPTPTIHLTSIPRTKSVAIPAGAAPILDGHFTSGEWDDAGQQTILNGDVRIIVYFKHDAANLYVAFDGLAQGETALFPELLLDTGFNSSLVWDEDDYWFHVSTNLCQGSGQMALWQQCETPNGWLATDFSQSLSTIEMQIPYETVGLQPGDDQAIGIGWAVMQITAADEEARTFWPETAGLHQPATWAKGTAVGDW